MFEKQYEVILVQLQKSDGEYFPHVGFSFSRLIWICMSPWYRSRLFKFFQHIEFFLKYCQTERMYLTDPSNTNILNTIKLLTNVRWFCIRVAANNRTKIFDRQTEWWNDGQDNYKIAVLQGNNSHQWIKKNIRILTLNLLIIWRISFDMLSSAW